MSYKSIDQAHNLLESVQILGARVDRWANELDRCKVLVERMSGIDPELPVVQGSAHSTGAEWDAYINTKEAYEKAVEDYSKVRDTVLGVMDRMNNLTYVKLLELRYLEKKVLTWEEIGGRMHLSKSYVHEMREKALAEFASVLNCAKKRTKADKSGQNKTI